MIIDKDAIISAYKGNELILQDKIKEMKNPFYNTFWVGFGTAVIAIISLILIFN